MIEAALLLDAKAKLGEGPSWDERSGELVWVDIEERKLHRYDPLTHTASAVPVPERIGAVVPRKSGGYVMALENGFYSFDPATNETALLANPSGRKPNTRFNDGKCDAAGRFWAGTMALDGSPGQGALYCLEPDLTVRTVIEPVTCSNGIAWSPDNRTMYYIDSPTKRVMAYDYDLVSGTIRNPRTAVDLTDGEPVPDGMTCDEEGMIWVALWGGYAVKRWNPHTGELLATVRVPAKQTTSCVFGGPELRHLYITSARIGLDETELGNNPLSGGLFTAVPGVRGLPTYAFGG